MIFSLGFHYVLGIKLIEDVICGLEVNPIFPYFLLSSISTESRALGFSSAARISQNLLLEPQADALKCDLVTVKPFCRR